jgi:hypothetical protein
MGIFNIKVVSCVEKGIPNGLHAGSFRICLFSFSVEKSKVLLCNVHIVQYTLMSLNMRTCNKC